MAQPATNDNNSQSNRTRTIMVMVLIAFAIVSAVVGYVYLDVISKRVYVENSLIEATQIPLAPKTGGVLEMLYVQAGDSIQADEIVAKVGEELVRAKDTGLVVSVQDQIGTFFNPGETVVTMIKPQDIRVDGSLEEDKGLNEVRVGQRVVFTVDAFSSKQYEGIVDEISPTSQPSQVIFNISNTRQENNFDVKVRFNISQYPELLNGMSAKMWIYK